MANIITLSRILFSIILLFTTVYSAPFYIFYFLSGITDVFDGAIARRTNTVSLFGSRLDTAADIVFAVVIILKMMSVITVPERIIVGIVIIAVIKIVSIVIGYFKTKKFAAVHSKLNKVSGAALFIFPLTVGFIEPKYSTLIVCAIAFAASVHELYLVSNGITTVS